MFEELTVPLCGFNDINRTKSSLKKDSHFSKHVHLMISCLSNTGIYSSLPKPLFLSKLFPPFPQILESWLLETTTRWSWSWEGISNGNKAMKSNEFSILDRCQCSYTITASHTTTASHGLTILMIKGARNFLSTENLREASDKDEVDTLSLKRPRKTRVNISDCRRILPGELKTLLPDKSSLNWREECSIAEVTRLKMKRIRENGKRPNFHCMLLEMLELTVSSCRWW